MTTVFALKIKIKIYIHIYIYILTITRQTNKQVYCMPSRVTRTRTSSYNNKQKQKQNKTKQNKNKTKTKTPLTIVIMRSHVTNIIAALLWIFIIAANNNNNNNSVHGFGIIGHGLFDGMGSSSIIADACIAVNTCIETSSSAIIIQQDTNIASTSLVTDLCSLTAATATTTLPIVEQIQQQQQQLLSSFSSLLTSSLSLSSTSSLFDNDNNSIDIGIGNNNNNFEKDLALWTIRIISGFVTYFGFVISTDRPRGKLELPLEPVPLLEVLPSSSIDDSNNSNSNNYYDDDNNNYYYLRVGPSKTAGLGLFVTQSLKKGTILGTYPGVVIPLQQHSASTKVTTLYPDCAEYIWRFTDNKYIIDPTNHYTGNLDEYCLGGNPSQLLSCTLFNILGGLSFLLFNNNKGGLFNCSTALCRINEPSKGYDVNVVTEEDLINRKVTFTLERDVFAGEELYIDYGLSYDRTKYQ
jgi:hypothetical protein